MRPLTNLHGRRRKCAGLESSGPGGSTPQTGSQRLCPLDQGNTDTRACSSCTVVHLHLTLTCICLHILTYTPTHIPPTNIHTKHPPNLYHMQVCHMQIHLCVFMPHAHHTLTTCIHHTCAPASTYTCTNANTLYTSIPVHLHLRAIQCAYAPCLDMECTHTTRRSPQVRVSTRHSHSESLMYTSHTHPGTQASTRLVWSPRPREEWL